MLEPSVEQAEAISDMVKKREGLILKNLSIQDLVKMEQQIQTEIKRRFKCLKNTKYKQQVMSEKSN